MERIDNLVKNICNNNPYGIQDRYTDKEVEYFYETYSSVQMINGTVCNVNFVDNRVVLSKV